MITRRDWQIFSLAPSLQYTYTLQDSNIDSAKFDARAVSSTLTKKILARVKIRDGFPPMLPLCIRMIGEGH